MVTDLEKIRSNIILTIIVSAIIILITFRFVDALPFGVTINVTGNSSSYTNSGSGSFSAYAGNITEMNIDGISITQSWAGYYGNVSGGLELADSTGKIFYNWSAVGTSGEVYASVNQSIVWTNIQCFNFSAAGNFSSDVSTRGDTSIYGMNVTELETQYNISYDDPAGVNETFNAQDHNKFYTNNLEFTQGECHNINFYNSTGQKSFEEVLLYSPDNRNVVYTSLVNHNTVGFADTTHDFEMLVLENGHGTDLNETVYYFYMELG